MLKILWNRGLRRLSSLQLAIGELALIALLSAVGTVIEQNKSTEYYMQVTAAPPVLLTCWRDTCTLAGAWLLQVSRYHNLLLGRPCVLSCVSLLPVTAAAREGATVVSFSAAPC